MRKALKQLISEKEKELQNLEDSLGLGFPIIEQAKTTRICHLEAELEDLRGLEGQIKLNDNQKIVLEQLKINAGSNGSLIKAIHSLYNLLTISSNRLEKDGARGLLKAKNALARLTRKQAAEVIAAFAQWGLEQEEAE
ncbi:TPA: hypothetical protein IYD21_001427 [Enterococcus faecium]|nr:hypothetical protein [Enterococcus faecium]HBC2692591.1 hypothetical protein [Enterococcus faecium]